MSARSIAIVCLAVVAGGLEAQRGPVYQKVHRLTPREGVFAYARISPDGERLVYASNITRGMGVAPQWTETVIDLASGRTLWTDFGIDAYWSPDGTRLIYGGDGGVVIRDMETGEAIVDAEASKLGDYYSWAHRDGRDLILTIENNYYYLDRNKVLLPHLRVTACPPVGTGERPLISKDGRRISTFVRGNVIVRSLDRCDEIFDTGIPGGKADFSWDGRYLAFHAIKADGSGYDIRIVDTKERTVRTLAPSVGSSLFPSWTKDGRLCFRYDGPDYRGFMIASSVLDQPHVPLRGVSRPLPDRRTWEDIFPETPGQPGVQLVLIWAPWSAHSQAAFDALRRAYAHFARRLPILSVAAAADPTSIESDVQRQLREFT